MPTFETPQPIAVTADLGVGAVRFVAGDRTDTQVTVRPSDDSDESDVKAARQVSIDYANGNLMITGPKAGPFDFSRKTRSVDVSVELPAGSGVTTATLQAGNFYATGRLGECRFKTAAGHVRLELTGPLRVDTGAGHVTVEGVAGAAVIHTGSGKVGAGPIEGSAEVTNSNGDITLESVTGEVKVRTANGDITVERAGAGVEAKTANGTIRLGEVARGTVVLGTAMGDLDIGIAEGTAAWLEVNTGFGHVHNLLDNADRKPDAADTVEVRARTTYGDITIRRS